MRKWLDRVDCLFRCLFFSFLLSFTLLPISHFPCCSSFTFNTKRNSCSASRNHMNKPFTPRHFLPNYAKLRYIDCSLFIYFIREWTKKIVTNVIQFCRLGKVPKYVVNVLFTQFHCFVPIFHRVYSWNLLRISFD